MRHWWFLLLFPTSLAVATDRQPERDILVLSLKQAVQMATAPEGNVQIQLSDEALSQARSRSAQSRAALLPNLDSSAVYRNQTANLRANGLQFDIPTGPGSFFRFPSLVGPYEVMDARITASQTIFDFSSIRHYQASRAGVSAALSDAAGAKESVAGQVARAYLAAVRADAEVDTAEANVGLSEAILNRAENQKRSGTGTGIEITRARVQLANDRQELLAAENSRRSMHMRLLRVLNLPLDTELDLTDKMEYVSMETMTLEEAKKLALDTRPDLKAQRERENAARLSASAAGMERLPSLAAFGDYGAIGSRLNESRPTRVYGVTLNIPIFDGGRMDARRAEAVSRYRAEKLRTNDIKDQVELELRLALDSLHSSKEQVAAANEGLELSRNELDQAERRYEAGMANGLEVTDAQTRLARARDNQIQALYNYNLARIDFEQAIGMLGSRFH